MFSSHKFSLPTYGKGETRENEREGPTCACLFICLHDGLCYDGWMISWALFMSFAHGSSLLFPPHYPFFQSLMYHADTHTMIFVRFVPDEICMLPWACKASTPKNFKCERGRLSLLFEASSEL